MFFNTHPPVSAPGMNGAALRAAILSSIAMDPVCCGADIDVAITPQSVVLTGVVDPTVAIRAKEIVMAVAGNVPVWDRMIWVC